MKKLELKQMESLDASGKGRDCLILGATTGGLIAAAIFLGPASVWAQVYGAGAIGSFLAGGTSHCWD